MCIVLKKERVPACAKALVQSFRSVRPPKHVQDFVSRMQAGSSFLLFRSVVWRRSSAGWMDNRWVVREKVEGRFFLFSSVPTIVCRFCQAVWLHCSYTLPHIHVKCAAYAYYFYTHERMWKIQVKPVGRKSEKLWLRLRVFFSTSCEWKCIACALALSTDAVLINRRICSRVLALQRRILSLCACCG